ncbi:hypothetical protein L596_000581 [Steinernema carpocapsae]|uniref:Uncharacterized protein n=1 Tax=Steinernema carpocapsae TaxID=34508 RepID=A0A4U8UII0_STECR|nr:hypothetical protein L596_000581 [Steinernema carpocapsae]
MSNFGGVQFDTSERAQGWSPTSAARTREPDDLQRHSSPQHQSASGAPRPQQKPTHSVPGASALTRSKLSMSHAARYGTSQQAILQAPSLVAFFLAFISINFCRHLGQTSNLFFH